MKCTAELGLVPVKPSASRARCLVHQVCPSAPESTRLLSSSTYLTICAGV